MGVGEIFKLTDLLRKIHKYSPPPCSIPQEANYFLGLLRPTVTNPVVGVHICPLPAPTPTLFRCRSYKDGISIQGSCSGSQELPVSHFL